MGIIRFFKRQGIAVQFNLLLLPLAVLIVGLTLLYSMSVTGEIVLEAAEDNAESVTVTAAHRLSYIVRAPESLCQKTAALLDTTRHDTALYRRIVSTMLLNRPDIYGASVSLLPTQNQKPFSVYAWRHQERICFKSLYTKAYDYTQKSWFQQAITCDTACWSQPYRDESGGETLMITYAVPFHDSEGQPEGFVTVDVPLSWIQVFVNELQYLDDGDVFLIDKAGNILARPRSEVMEESKRIFDAAAQEKLPGLILLAHRMIRGETGFETLQPEGLHQKVFIYFAPLPSVGWSLGVAFPEQKLYREGNRLHLHLALLGLFGILILMLVIILVSRNITSPVRKLALASMNLGYGNLELEIPELKTSQEIKYLSASFRQMQQQLQNYITELKASTAAREKIESELKVARRIQQNMLPVNFPKRPEADIFALLHPARAVGGDLYDFFFLDQNRLVFALGDVSGKGVPAALFMAITHTLLRAKSRQNSSPGQIMTEMNRELCRDNRDSMFVTLFIGELTLDSGRLRFCNAGHNYPYQNTAGVLKCMKTKHGLPAGVFEESLYETSEIMLGNGDMLILYTDGVPEAMNEDGGVYSDGRLMEFLEARQQEDVRMLCENLLKDVAGFSGNCEQSDDITLLALKWKAGKLSG